MSVTARQEVNRSANVASRTLLLLLALMAGNMSGAKAAASAKPVVEGPIQGTPSLQASGFDLAKAGYEQGEYFISGTAHGFLSSKPLQSDGKWQVKRANEAQFKTRIVVYRPQDAAKFNGTVVFEWLNVSGGSDAAPDWVSSHTELIRQGYAWVGVSAQKAGIDGGGLNLSRLKVYCI